MLMTEGARLVGAATDSLCPFEPLHAMQAQTCSRWFLPRRSDGACRRKKNQGTVQNRRDSAPRAGPAALAARSLPRTARDHGARCFGHRLVRMRGDCVATLAAGDCLARLAADLDGGKLLAAANWGIRCEQQPLCALVFLWACDRLRSAGRRTPGASFVPILKVLASQRCDARLPTGLARHAASFATAS